MAGFYGLDLYNLSRLDPRRDRLSRRRRSGRGARWRASATAAFCPGRRDPARYGRLAISEGYARCRAPVLAMLRELHARRLLYAAEDGDEWLDAAANARLVKNAEAYYRVMYYGAAESWNLRDTHMFETLCQLLDAKGPDVEGGGLGA